MSSMTQIKASAGSGKTYTLTREFLRAMCGCTAGTASSGACSLTGPEADWRSVMAITFTNAAASEMQERVLRILKEAALQLGDDKTLSPHEARGWLELILRERSSLNISTIDSLLNLILRMSALGQNLPPDFTPVFRSEDILKPCWDQYCAEAWLDSRGQARQRIDAATRAIVNWDTYDSFASGNAILLRITGLVTMLIKNEMSTFTPQDFFQTSSGDGRLPALRRDILACADILLDANGSVPGGERKALACKKNFISAVELVHSNFAAALGVSQDEATLADYALAQPDEKGLNSAYFQKDALPVNKGSCPPPANVQTAYHRLCNYITDYRRLSHMYKQLQSLAPVQTLAADIYERYRRMTREEGRVLNDQIPVLVRSILSGEHGVAEALCRLGTRISHFLVDEFQDTSRDHWEALRPLVVEALSSGGSFSWVGDVKQAIYGFRGGDSQLFDDVAAEPELTCLLETPPLRRSLNENWRSATRIIDFNNALFSPLDNADFCASLLRARCKKIDDSFLCRDLPSLCADASAPERKLVDYMADKIARAYRGAAQQYCPNSSAGGRVVLASFAPFKAADADANTNPDEDGDRNTETSAQADPQAQAVGSIILKGLETRPWSDFLVLVRTNSQAMKLAHHLTSLGMPVITENSLNVAEHPLIIQTIALLTFLRAPEDDVAFWTLVSGDLADIRHDDELPACSHEEACARAGDIQGSNADSTNDSTTVPPPLTAWHDDPRACADHDLLCLSRARSRDPDGQTISLSQVWRQRWPRTWERVIEPLLRAGATLTPYNLVSAWYERIKASTRFPDAEPFLRRFLEILHASDQRGLHGLDDFLNFWTEHGAEEKVPMPENLNAISIMTVHKSKGLQAKVVIVPWTSSKSVSKKSLGVTEYVTRTDGTLVRTLCHQNELFPAKTHTQLREAFEAVNRFYVAFTRAEEELYVFTDEKAQDDGILLEYLITHGHGLPPVTPWEELKDQFVSPDDTRQDSLSDTSRELPAFPDDALPDSDASRTMPAGTLSAGDAAFWQPMAWLPELRLHFDFMDESHPRDIAREEGVFTHGCLEELARLPAEARRPGPAFSASFGRLLEERARKAPWLAGREGFLERVRADVVWFMELESRYGWFDRGFPEQTLTRGGRNRRMDLYVPGQAASDQGTRRRALVLEYKTGLAEERFVAEHHLQVRDYIACLMEAAAPGSLPPAGLVIYLRPRLFHFILPGSARRDSATDLSLTDETAFAQAMEAAGLAPNAPASLSDPARYR